MKSYVFKITVKWTNIIEGKTKKEAIKRLKESFIDEFNIKLDDNEIKGGDNL